MKRTICSILLCACVLCACRQGAQKPAQSEPKPLTKEQKELKLADFAYSLLNMSPEQAQWEVKTFFKRNESDTAALQLLKRYLYDPNSPYRSEDNYLPLAKCLAESEYTPEELRASYRRDAQKCSLNRCGQVATDFTFRTIGGKNIRMHSVPGEYTMLFFSNPGCTACKGIIDQVQSVEPIYMAIESGRLSVVNVYIDKELDAWKEYSVNYPKTWYNGYDPTYTLRENSVYNIRAIPSLYLLDSEKKVIMKDAPTERVLMYLVNVLQ